MCVCVCVCRRVKPEIILENMLKNVHTSTFPPHIHTLYVQLELIKLTFGLQHCRLATTEATMAVVPMILMKTLYLNTHKRHGSGAYLSIEPNIRTMAIVSL